MAYRMGGVSLDGENLVVFYNIKSGLIIALRFTMGFNATFNNISLISWQSVLLVEETGVPRENHRPVSN
jgi:hypothetical protein